MEGIPYMFADDSFSEIKRRVRVNIMKYSRVYSVEKINEKKK